MFTIALGVLATSARVSWVKGSAATSRLAKDDIGGLKPLDIPQAFSRPSAVFRRRALCYLERTRWATQARRKQVSP
jgi:hypothetical protein